MTAESVVITHREEFSAAHRLLSPYLSESENRALYGPCFTLHGHNYAVEVSVAGPLDLRTGMVLDLNRLMLLMRRELIEPTDHKYLNEDVDFLRGLIPTAEVLARSFWQRLQPHFARGEVRLSKVRVVESAANWADYEGGSV